jgi:hypothetical protein
MKYRLTRFVGTPILASMLYLTASMVCNAQIINLPLKRTVETGYSISNAAGTLSEFYTPSYWSDPAYDVDLSDTSTHTMALSELDLSAYNYTYAEVHADGTISISETVSHESPNLFLGLEGSADAIVEESETTRTAISSYYGTLTNQAWFVVEPHAVHNSAGQATNSATLTTYFNLEITGDVVDGSIGTLISFAVNDSYIDIAPLDETGESYSVQGSLSRTTSADPDAEPESVDETYLSGTLGNWFVDEATQVGGGALVYFSLFANDSVTADNDPLSDYPLSASISEQYYDAYVYMLVHTDL